MPKKSNSSGANLPRHQKDGARAVVEDPSLPRMGEGELQPRRIGRKILLMSAESASTPKGKRMKEVPRMKGGKPKMPSGGFADQRPPGSSKGKAAQEASGYVRLRVRLEGGELALVGARFVEGALLSTASVQRGLVYDVTLGKRRLAAGAIPDHGEMRSFPDPLGRPGMEGHNIEAVASHEFQVRIPREELSLKALESLEIALYDLGGDEQEVQLAEGRSMATQFRSVAKRRTRLRGIKVGALSKKLQAEVRRALK